MRLVHANLISKGTQAQPALFQKVRQLLAVGIRSAARFHLCRVLTTTSKDIHLKRMLSLSESGFGAVVAWTCLGYAKIAHDRETCSRADPAVGPSKRSRSAGSLSGPGGRDRNRPEL